jgi:hypothetical protein
MLAALMLGQAAALAVTAPAPRFCPNRPDLGASACTTEPGRVLVEASFVDWTRDDTADAREDTVLGFDFLARFGVGPRTEVQLGWTPVAHLRTRDKATGAVSTTDGVGDVRLAVRQNLRGNEGGAVALAVEPFVTLPIARAGLGAGDWSGGVVLPMSYALDDGWTVSFTGDATVTPDEDSVGRQVVLGGALGLGRGLSETVSVVGELAATRERDGGRYRTALVTALSLGWQPRSGLQIDLLGVAGLNRAAPDLQMQVGGAILF